VELWHLDMEKHKLVAIFGHRYEPMWMVKQAVKNLKPIVDDFAILDDRGHDKLWRHEGEYRKILRNMALDKGATWLLVTSPDERWEVSATHKIWSEINKGRREIVLGGQLREMWTPNKYRIDGIWGRKARYRIFPISKNQDGIFENHHIQSPCYPTKYPLLKLDLNIYHLKMIGLKNRIMRAKVFKKLDPDNSRQDIGYDYLYQEEGMELESIPRGREYYPSYRKWTFKVPERYLDGEG
jgi:hypothetical protein